MRNLLDIFVRFSHVFFVSRCCNKGNDAIDEEILKAIKLREERREVPEEQRDEETSEENLLEGDVQFQEEIGNKEVYQKAESSSCSLQSRGSSKEKVDEELYDVILT